MKTSYTTLALFSLLFVAFLHQSTCRLDDDDFQSLDCMRNFFDCWVNGTNMEEYRATEIRCCENLISNVTFNFLSTFAICVQDEYVDVILSCFDSSGSDCARILPRTFLQHMGYYNAFNRNVLQSVVGPVGVEDCSRFASDLEVATYNMCQENTEIELQDMCDAITSVSNK